jgi:hypothetical protein
VLAFSVGSRKVIQENAEPAVRPALGSASRFSRVCCIARGGWVAGQLRQIIGQHNVGATKRPFSPADTLLLLPLDAIFLSLFF